MRSMMVEVAKLLQLSGIANSDSPIRKKKNDNKPNYPKTQLTPKQKRRRKKRDMEKLSRRVNRK